MTLQRGFKAKAERISMEIRDKIGIPASGSFEPERVCRYFDIEIKKLSDISCDTGLLVKDSSVFSSMIVRRGIRIAIVHNDAHHIHRQRSNICHELAHCFLNHEHCTVANDNGTREYDSRIEAEAAYLGGALLLPRETAIHILKSGKLSVAVSEYGVSRKMLTWRLRASGAQTIYNRSIAKYGQRYSKP